MHYVLLRQRVRIGVGGVGECPSIRSCANIQLTLSAAAALVPVPLVRGPVTDARRAGGGTIGERSVAKTDGSCAVERSCGIGLKNLVDVLHVEVPTAYNPKRG